MLALFVTGRSGRTVAQTGSNKESTVPSVQLRDLRWVFRDAVALQEFRVDAASHEFVSLLGRSGREKITALRIVAGFEYPDSGGGARGRQGRPRPPRNRRDEGELGARPEKLRIERFTDGPTLPPSKARSPARPSSGRRPVSAS
jgi:energy-coupling factor transporter ATP-binding protein EcfA2